MPVRRVVIDHVTIGVSDLDRSRAFYRAALAPLGFVELGPWRDGVRESSFGAEGADDFAVSLEYPVNGGAHIAFAAETREQVDDFHREALAAGGRDNGGPGLRPEYSDGYYGAFAFDPDGYNVEAVYHADD
jgi:catechol 2,3-dioxygenase-like lactoylglutathione lyase family enzyme